MNRYVLDLYNLCDLKKYTICEVHIHPECSSHILGYAIVIDSDHNHICLDLKKHKKYEVYVYAWVQNLSNKLY